MATEFKRASFDPKVLPWAINDLADDVSLPKGHTEVWVRKHEDGSLEIRTENPDLTPPDAA